jgi:hypothetical protein
VQQLQHRQQPQGGNQSFGSFGHTNTGHGSKPPARLYRQAA